MVTRHNEVIEVIRKQYRETVAELAITTNSQEVQRLKLALRGIVHMFRYFITKEAGKNLATR